MTLSRQETTACASCGMACDHRAEFHPYAFCVLKKAGRDPWNEFRYLVELYYGRDSEAFKALPSRPPRVTEVPNRLMSHA